ncbi:MAG TPA: DUF1467 family protein [Hyphomicrobiales bacterium]|nr:DUF1467 family protein [Hyphomicrobiales bacterium]
MSLTLAFAVYFICWWIALFAILPLQIGPKPDESRHDPFADAAGAPRAPNIGLKFLVTTIVSALIFAVIFAVVHFNLLVRAGLFFL